ncbi:MAG TPA: aminoacyl-tRNA hydrolase [Stackebrandtia sp.]|jgi:PTH1 family peptidyl-tRNA hydrolase|uniref:aminoacyl-tRNA hydrolase n=1 Tax=Stackebrandtia sp. TaxID=2023065 RepID=UPI002D37C82F|nr:aminoacyl-tRNA hydrolase [Stackebrandtia sp.]HZE40505.1 aminoacyl-tRNA hydrolase [Stackebrandtia sp.]
MADSPYLIAGLGNPGAKYAGNRHNVGFMIADLLAERVGGSASAAWKRKGRAEVCEGRFVIGGPKVILVKPMTFMNVSGQAVAPLASFFKIPPERIIVVHDELDLPYGVVRLKSGGGEGGHNGLRSISQSLGTKAYVRARFGVGRPPGRMDAAAYVLKDFSASERTQLPLFVDLTADAVSEVVSAGLTGAQNKYHALS